LRLLPRFGGTESQAGGRRDVGGAAVTEESHPVFRNSVAAYTASLINPKVIADMNLSAHGLTVVERRASNFLL
jgi:hypothetical protein